MDRLTAADAAASTTGDDSASQLDGCVFNKATDTRVRLALLFVGYI